MAVGQIGTIQPRVSTEVMPTFLVIGAGKAGTTSFYSYLKQHPQIYLSPTKEPLFLACENSKFNGPGDSEINARIIRTLDDYQDLFQGSQGFQARGEGSTAYLYYSRAAERAYQLIPDAKFFVLLRSPVERAYSNYLHALRAGSEPLWDFEAALEAEEERIVAGWSHAYHYKSKGFYYRQLCHWLEFFPREQFKIFLYEDLTRYPQAIMREAFGFLDVCPDHEVSFAAKLNVSPSYRALQLRQFLRGPISMLKPFIPSKARRRLTHALTGSGSSKVASHLRQRLSSEYAADLSQLSKLINRDLTHWLT